MLEQDKKRQGQASSTSSEECNLEEILKRIEALEDENRATSRLITSLQDRLDEAESEIDRVNKLAHDLQKSLEFTQNVQNEVTSRVTVCEQEQVKIDEKVEKQDLYTRRWNLLFHGVDENKDEDCEDVVDDILSAKLGLDADEIRYCSVHRLGRKSKGRKRPIIARFTCRSDRDTVWRKKWKLRSTKIFISEDPPYKTRELRRRILIPAAKRARRIRGTKVTIIGDRLVVDSRIYLHNQIPE